MATNIIKSERPDILDAAVAEVLKIPQAVGDKAAGKMCLSASGIIYWRGKGPMPDEPRQAVGEELLRWLNKEAWLDGQWVVIWADYDFARGHYTRLAWCFLDKDNDLLLQIDCDDPLEVMIFAIPDYVEMAIEGFMQLKSAEKDLGVTEEDKIKAALGQKSVDADARPTFIPMMMD